MGSNLADMVTQGNAGPTEFHSAPLWGLGQRLFFLHDGRTSDLLHSGKLLAPSGNRHRRRTQIPKQKQGLLNFLRSL